MPAGGPVSSSTPHTPSAPRKRRVSSDAAPVVSTTAPPYAGGAEDVLEACAGERVVDERRHAPHAGDAELLKQRLGAVAEQERDGVPGVEALRAPERGAAVGLTVELGPRQRADERAQRRGVRAASGHGTHGAGHPAERRARQPGGKAGERFQAVHGRRETFEHAPFWHAHPRGTRPRSPSAPPGAGGRRDPRQAALCIAPLDLSELRS